MQRKNYIFTSESVSEGHPDKICDRISDEVLDLILKTQPEARVACETLATTDFLVIAGEIGRAKFSKEEVIETARQAVKDIGYEQEGFHWKHFKAECRLHQQSADIAMGVDANDNKEEGAGDQGIMFGYAVNETAELMPAPILYSHKILQILAQERKSGRASFLQPDAKSQVTMRYENDKPVHADKIVISTQHIEGFSGENLAQEVKKIASTAFSGSVLSDKTEWLINPTGNFVIGGPDGDCGLTGRKIIVDTYGGAAPHGGGAFSGKDPTKVDRSAAYICRYLAKNVVAAQLAEKCTIQISYAIGVSRPLSFYVNLHGTGNVSAEELEKILPEIVDLSPRGIRKHLQLNRPIYARTAAYGHFGRTPDEDGGFSWEKCDLVVALQSYFNIKTAVAG